MSNLISIEDLKKEFEQKSKAKELKEFAQAQQNLIEKLFQENKFLKEKLLQLEGIITQPTPEEMICVEQIEILKKTSKNRELTLDEVKRLDLLIKNLRLIKEQSTENVATPKYREVTEADLVAIASSTPSEDQ